MSSEEEPDLGRHGRVRVDLEADALDVPMLCGELSLRKEGKRDGARAERGTHSRRQKRRFVRRSRRVPSCGTGRQDKVARGTEREDVQVSRRAVVERRRVPVDVQRRKVRRERLPVDDERFWPCAGVRISLSIWPIVVS